MTQDELEAKMDEVNRERLALQQAAYATCIKPDTHNLLEQAEAKAAEWQALYAAWIPPHAR